MAYVRAMLFYASVFLGIQFVSCFQQEHGGDTDKDILGGMTDREIILKLIQQNDDLVKMVRNLENWNHRQQRDIGNLQTTVRKQERRLQLLNRILVSSTSQELPEPTRKESTEEATTKLSLEYSRTFDAEDERKSGNHGLPKVRVQPPRNRIVEKDIHGVRNGFEGQVRHTRQSETSNRVAFFASINAHIENLGAGQIVEFQNVATNIGNAYISNTGIFTAPVPGTYVFSASLMGRSGGHDDYFAFTKNHVTVSRFEIDSQNRFATTSHTVILELQQGDNVEIRSEAAGRAVFGNNCSCFSGFLLYEDETSGVVVG